MMKAKLIDFGERLLSTKLVFCAVVWSAANIWLIKKVIDASIYRDITAIVVAGVLGASFIDKKASNGKILDDVK